jgi:hypothetical protein
MKGRHGMRKLFLSVIATGVLLSSTAGIAAAQQGRIKQRKENQQKRIGEGVENGSLNAREAARLEGREAKLNREIRRDKADGGGLTTKEKVKIEHKQDKLSKDIYKQKHDAQTHK